MYISKIKAFTLIALIAWGFALAAGLSEPGSFIGQLTACLACLTMLGGAAIAYVVGKNP